MKTFYLAFCFSLLLIVAGLRTEAACPVTISAGGPALFCTGDSLLLTASPGVGYLYQWKKNNLAVSGATAQTYYAKTTGNYTVTVTVVSPACTTTSNTILATAETPLYVTITNTGASMCSSSTDLLEVPYRSSYLYQWYEDNIILPLSNSCQLYTGHSGNYSCSVTNTCGTYSSSAFVLTDTISTGVIQSGNTSFCAGGSCTLSSQYYGRGVSYQWFRDGVALPRAENDFYVAKVAGTYVLRITDYCGWTGTNYLNVYSNFITTTILPGTFPSAPGVITGLASGICGNTTGYSVGAVAGASTYNWTVPGGVIVNSGQGTSAINITYPIPFSSGSISVNAENTCGMSGSASLALTNVLAPAGPILGLTDVCEMKTYVYSVAPVEGATNYTWSVPAKARVQHGQGTATAEIKMSRYAGNITVTASNGCITSATSVLAVTLTDVGCGPVHRDERILNAEVYPNPTTHFFTLSIFSDSNADCIIIIRDITGRELERREHVTPGKAISFGDQLVDGIYLAEVIQGEERIVLRMVKSE